MFRVKRDQRDRGCSELFCEEGEVGCRSGSRYSTVAIGIRRICHSFIGLKRVTEGLLSSSHRQMAEKAFHMFLLSQMLCCRETATRSGTEILTIGVICVHSSPAARQNSDFLRVFFRALSGVKCQKHIVSAGRQEGSQHWSFERQMELKYKGRSVLSLKIRP